MKKFIQYAFLKSLVISVGFDFICILYGFISKNHYDFSIIGGVIFFFVLFISETLEYLWKNRKNIGKRR